MFTYLLDAGDQDVINHIARLDAAETLTVKTAVSALILGLKYDAIWSKIGILCVAHNVESDSLFNLKGPTSFSPDSVIINSPVFTASRGFLTAYDSTPSSAAYINLLVTETGALLYELYDAHVMIYLRTVSSTATDIMVGFSGTAVGGPATSGIIVDTTQSPDELTSFNFHSNTGPATDNIIVPQNNPIGCYIVSITSSSNRLGRLNDTAVSNTTTHTTLSLETDINKFMKIGVDAELNNAANPGEQFAAWGVGGGLTAAEMGLYEDRIRTYMQAIGADVY